MILQSSKNIGLSWRDVMSKLPYDFDVFQTAIINPGALFY